MTTTNRQTAKAERANAHVNDVCTRTAYKTIKFLYVRSGMPFMLDILNGFSGYYGDTHTAQDCISECKVAMLEHMRENGAGFTDHETIKAGMRAVRRYVQQNNTRVYKHAYTDRADISEYTQGETLSAGLVDVDRRIDDICNGRAYSVIVEYLAGELTTAQIDILRRLAKGQTQEQISKAYGITQSSVARRIQTAKKHACMALMAHGITLEILA